MRGRYWLSALLMCAVLMATDAKAGSARIISVLSYPIWNMCRSASPACMYGSQGYGVYVAEGYEPLGVYRSPQEPRMYVIAPSAKIISVEPVP